MNDLNIDFYDKIAPNKLQSFAELLGMTAGKDVDTIFPLIKDSKAILELGSGYGRVINCLLKLGFQGKIIGIERIHFFLDILNKKFPQNQVEILEQDLRLLNISGKVGAVLWMWSGILELSVEEQVASVQKCYEVLEEGGKLIIEVPHQKIHHIGKLDAKRIKVEEEWATLEAYLTDEEDIKLFVEKVAFKNYEKITYRTDKDLERAIYVLTK